MKVSIDKKNGVYSKHQMGYTKQVSFWYSHNIYSMRKIELSVSVCMLEYLG